MFAIIPSRPEVGDLNPKVWPHISVMPWVQLGDYRQEVLAEARQIVHDRMPVNLRPGRMTTVGGEGHEKRAQRIHSNELPILHEKLLWCLASFGIMVSHPEWAGPNYKPHITTDTPMLLRPTSVDAIYVVDNIKLNPDDDRGTKQVSDRLVGGHED